MTGQSDEVIGNFKTGLLSLARKDIITAAEKYFDGRNKAVTVISSEEKLQEANKKLGDQALELFKI